MDNYLKILIKKIQRMIVFLARNRIIFLKDKTFLKIVYRIVFNKKLDLQNPKTFNEKLQWIKIYDKKEIYPIMVDKYLVKSYVANIIGEEYIIKTFKVYDKFSDIEFKDLPDSFVLKTTHYGGGEGVYIIKDKNNIDYKKIKKEINKILKKNLFFYGREWVYRKIKPRIIIEELLYNHNCEELKDYKLFCFNGKVEIILVCSNRNGNHKNTNFYDVNWNLLPFTRTNHLNNSDVINKPNNLEEMIKVAEKLAENIPFIRVDLYDVNDNVYFGELTFYPSSGFEGFDPEEWDIKLGDMLKLPINNVKEKNEK